MLYLTTILWCIPSPLFMFINAEAWVLGNVALGNGDPPWIGLCAAAGQMIGYTACFFGGAQVMQRLPKLRDKVARFDVDKHKGAAYFVLLFGAIVGWPPAVILTLLGRTLNYHFVPYFIICALGRVVRFETLALLPEKLGPLFGR